MRYRECWSAALATLALHAGLLWIFLERPPTRTAGADVAVVEAFLLPPPSNEVTSPDLPTDQRPNPVSTTTPAFQPQHTASKPARGQLDHGQAGPERFGYLSFDEVDQAAEPLGDWVIDTDMLPRGMTLRIVLQVWISAAGGIDRWELVGDTDSTAIARRALVDLSRTPMQAAFLKQQPVASFRRLEILLQRD